MKAELNDILAEHCGQSVEKVAADTERDYFMSGEEAVNYGLIDNIVVRKTVGATADK